MRRSLAFALIALALASPAYAQRSDEAFRNIYTREYAARQAASPASEAETGPRSPFGRVDPAYQAERLANWERVLRELDRIDQAGLSAEAKVNYAVYRQQIEVNLAQQRFRDWEKPLNSDTAFWTGPSGGIPARFTSEQQARSFINRLRGIKPYFDAQTANMRAGLRRGFTPPKVTLQGRDNAILAVANAKTVEESVFWAPFREMPSSFSPALQEELRRQGREAIETSALRAYKDFLIFFQNEYVPGAVTALGAEQLPDGRAYYQSKIKEFTTLDLTPDQIHQIGLAEMAKIRARMTEVIKQTGFQGDFPAFLTYLRTDPRFYAKTSQELLMQAAWISKQFDARASRYFGRLPRSRFAIRPVPDDIAPYYTSGRGGAGTYLVNTYNLPARPLYAMVALTLHESAPGHAWQIPLSSEQEGLPQFRRSGYISAYGEGWALYCELLGEEMGMYETPYDLFGMLSYQAWRAARLVVDTGVHSKGWTREQAQAYLRDNTALAEHEITTEVDRYIAWPGQALSYYLGQMTIVEARNKAEAALGTRFNLRYFHDAVLQMGSVPMPVLTARIDRWIADGGPDPYRAQQ